MAQTKPLKVVGKAQKKFVIPPELMEAEKLRAERKLDEAMRACALFMNENCDHVPAIVLAAHIMLDAERYGVAHPLMVRATQLCPEESIVWNNLALCYVEMENREEAERCFIRALNRNPEDSNALANLAKLYNEMGEHQKAINCADRAILVNTRIPEARYNKGISLLAQGKWREGWEGYEFNLGKHEGRRERVYGTIPRWTGEKGLTLIAYGEQGIGDEISFASCLPDLKRENTVIIECDARLVGLFRRSFGCEVYGTRYVKGGLAWPSQHPIDATVAFGSLPGFYRNSLEDFPGTPYLIADPERRIQWRALLASLGSKKKVGITWTGGIKKTGAALRSMELTDLLPVLRQDATFISLQYKDAGPEVEALEKTHGIKVHHWPHATQTKDYDDTAALVAELDLVITVQQSAVHLAGALGVPACVLLPKAPLWRYGVSGDTMPWYKSVKLYRYRGNDWVHSVSEAAADLRKLAAGGQ